MSFDKPLIIVYLLSGGPALRDHLNAKGSPLEFVVADELQDAPLDVASRVKGVLFGRGTYGKQTKAFAVRFSDIKVVCSTDSRTDQLNLALWRSRGVQLGCSAGTDAEATAEFAITLIMATARRMKKALMYPYEERSELFGVQLSRKTLGIIGMENIGYKIAQKMVGFEMNIMYHDRRRRPPDDEKAANAVYSSDLHDLLRQADVILITCQLNQASQRLIGKNEFRIMKPSAILVNVARGGMVDTNALVDALRTERIFGAGLDVTDPSPLPPNHPLHSMDNVILTPHIGGNTPESRHLSFSTLIANLMAGIEGRPLSNPV